jgi:hydrogenase expression/formation protein HypD
LSFVLSPVPKGEGPGAHKIPLMKYLTEFRNGEIAQRMAREIAQITTRPWKIMEVCGGQTHSIIKNGIDQMLPPGIEMIHGPGCPVCVTPLELIDKALAIAAQPGVIFCSFGDMLRVPGTEGDLFQVKGRGGDVRVVYSPLDAVELAAKNPDKQVVFFGVGFETTAPANAMSVHLAKRRGLKNFSVLVSHVLVPPAIEAIMSSPGNHHPADEDLSAGTPGMVQAFLAAGHVCSVMGYWQYPPLAEKFGVPIVVTGFEPLDLLDGIRRAVVQLEAGRHEVENAYNRVVTFEGNRAAQKLLSEVFEVTDRAWRGIGVIPKSGWRLNAEYRDFDAERRFQITGIHTQESPLCHSGDVLRGAIKPAQCPAFGKECTPRHPLGATMVSSEGACAAYYNYGRFLSAEELAGAGKGSL